ncbi:MAG: ABC transporter ATP-binding protein [Acidimicrobiia bacterium]
MDSSTHPKESQGPGSRDEKIRLTNVSKSFGGRKVVDIERLDLGRHGIEGLIGPNGAGKTTLMNLITHQLRADSGEVIYSPNHQGTSLTQKKPDEIARLGIVKSNQIIQDFESLTIKDSMLLANCPPRYERFYRIFSEGQLREESADELAEYLEYFHFQDASSYALSAGEKKLLDIIRCLLLKPRFLLLDEPTAGLPEDQTNLMMELMAKKTKEEDISILIVEHDLDLIWEVCEFVHFMAEGEILLQGSPTDIRGNRTLAEKYLGSSHV